MKNIYFYLVIIGIIASSCSSKKNLAYFQDLSLEQSEIQGASYAKAITYRENDELSIIISAADPQAASAFNVIVSTNRSEMVTVTGSEVLQSYIVDSEGYINFPVLGKIKVAGLTKQELTALLENRLKESIKNPIVTIKLLNLRVGVLGEVNAPGDYSFENQRVSILDALAQAKDLTVYGNRESVLVIRDNENGKKEYYRLDLTKSDILFSPNFYLQQNDIVYVEPSKVRQREGNVGSQDQFRLSIVSTIVSATSLAASIMIALFIKK